jgi:hypothetical protein
LLLWNRTTNRLHVTVEDFKLGESFAVSVPERANPLDVFHHPYAYTGEHVVSGTAVPKF